MSNNRNEWKKWVMINSDKDNRDNRLDIYELKNNNSNDE